MLNLAAWVVVVASAAKGCHFYFAHRVTFLSCAHSLIVSFGLNSTNLNGPVPIGCCRMSGGAWQA